MDEPILSGKEIQGDGLAGFRKDFVSLLFLEFDAEHIQPVKQWLRSIPLATLSSVHAFNTAFSLMRRQLRRDPPLLACWINLGLTAPGLRKLIDQAEVDKLGVAFNQGADGRSTFVGDPSNGSPGDARSWVIGGPGNVPDAMLIIAGDDENDVASEVRSIRKQIDSLAPGVSPVRIMYEQAGQTVPGKMKGHEHFGFKDGISQPGVRGYLDSPTRPLQTARFIDGSDPLGKLFAAPGQPLLWPGEFVKGYPEMDFNDPLKPIQNPVNPDWIRNGSFLVFRRLYQDVAAFRQFIADSVQKLNDAGLPGINAKRLGAMCIGRWASGTPILRAPLADDPNFLGNTNDAVNSFFYDVDTDPVIWDPSTGRQPDTLPPARRDFDGVTCPLAAHIRKINPRDEPTDQGPPERTFKHRILRRGIPYGEVYDPEKPGSERQDRGLLFIAYQSSIEGQFEFLQRTWVNASDGPRGGAGLDPILGLNGNDDPAKRTMWFVKDDDTRIPLVLPERLVIATGGAYAFVPSISTIQNVLSR